MPENFGEAIQDLTINTSLLLKDDMDTDLTMMKKNQAIPTRQQQQRNQRTQAEVKPRPSNFDKLPWEEQKLIYEQEIKDLKQQLINQNKYFSHLLELPSDLEQALRMELGDETFNSLYYGNNGN